MFFLSKYCVSSVHIAIINYIEKLSKSMLVLYRHKVMDIVCLLASRWVFHCEVSTVSTLLDCYDN